MTEQLIIRDDLSLVICGEAGQGIDTVAEIISSVSKLSCFNVFSTKEYMSRIRGGSNSTEVRIASERVSAYLDRIDILVPLHANSVNHVSHRISRNTIILGEQKNIPQEYQSCCKVIYADLSKIALEAGGKIFENTVATGVICGLIGINNEYLNNILKETFSQKGDDIIAKNLDAAKRGYELGKELLVKENIQISIQKDEAVINDVVLTGNEATTYGLIAGGCNFISSYPMSPGTGVLTLLAKNSDKFGILVEQAEDEISAINMSIGAWYAGAKAMITTSGGGFALMTEGVSLAGMIESPAVIHIAQRPGPATGLPTRTEQGDLELALYSGHGEFPRIILAPGNLEDAFYVSQKAFNLADKYQVPVFLLTDQYLLDSYYNVSPFNLDNINLESHIVKTEKDYMRYKLSENPLSPRGIPGYGDGLVLVDSDEHDEEGHITENLELRVKMMDKRLKKLELIKQDIIEPELIGNSDYKTLLVGWGSTCEIIKEALIKLNRKDIAFLYFKQVYPVHSSIKEYLRKAQNTVIIENNATSQFGKLIKLGTGIDIQNKILKYNGLPFSVEELIKAIEEKSKILAEMA